MRKLLVWGGLIVIVFAAAIVAERLFTKPVEIPTATARKGELLIGLTVTGEVDAKRAQTIVAPRIRNLQITWLAPEGSAAKAGDPLVRFDSSQQQADLNDNLSTLKINRTSLERARQEYAIQEKQLKLNLEQAQRNYDEKKHEAPKVAEEARLELDLAELNAKAKLDQIQSDVQKAELEVQRAKDKVAQAQKDLDQMTLTAPIPGMVVYLNIWKGSTEGKVQTGDSPWPGQGLINLPDLSEMIVKATASEVDASAIKPGQEAVVTLDAFPDAPFKGVVDSKGTLARRKDMTSKINVFDVEIGIRDKDERLKPGMTASAKVIVDRLADVVSVPLEAVFEKNGGPVVYLANRKAREVQVGRRNDMEMEIQSGLAGGEVVCLVDPTLARQALPGEKATEPELNQGRSVDEAPAPPRGGRRDR